MDKNLKRIVRRTAAAVGLGACIGLAAAANVRAQAWQAAYGLSNAEDAARGGVIAEASGKIVAAGHARYINSNDVFVVKTDGCYTAEWMAHYDMGGDEVARKIRLAGDGGYIVVGTSTNASHCGTTDDIFLLKLDVNGNVQWAKTYGGDGIDEGWDVQWGVDGYVIAGSTTSYGIGGRDAFLMKTDLGGNVVWSTTYGNIGDEYFRSCALAANGDILATGARGSTISLVRYNSTGSIIWSSYGGGSNAVGWRVIECSNGDIAIAGAAADYSGIMSGFITRLSSNGAYMTDRVCRINGGPDEFHDMTQMSNGHLLVTGTLASTTGGFGGRKMYVGEYDAALNLVSDRTHGGPRQEEGWGVAYVPNIGGLPEYAAAGVTLSFGVGGPDMYLVRQQINHPDNCGRFTAEVDLNIMQPAYAFSPAYDPWTWPAVPRCNVDVTTRKEGTTTLICSDCVGNSALKPMIGQTGVEAPEDGGSIQAYPNPIRSGESLKLRVADPADGKASVTVSDLAGTVIYNGEGNASSGEVAVATDGWSDGVYLIRVKIGETIYSSRVIVGGNKP